MNPRRNAIAAWDFSRWFAVLSPLIGVLLGFVGAFSYFTERREYGMNATALKRFRVNGRNTPPNDSSAPARPTVPPTTRHGFTGHVAGTIRCLCSTCWPSIRQRFGNASSIRLRSARMSGYETNNIPAGLSQSRHFLVLFNGPVATTRTTTSDCTGDAQAACATRGASSLDHIGKQTGD
jgi:hypothetical protein